ncbi:hypothetical protein FOL47_000747 [Perkinsus chesapeaki]|uniref:Uncharacterized protein n=1 Tax=Perkinsus chesapeaki TaxID=330153 RepID=A0A7J6MMP9_PERCH|nr:hypothetical protein FOL47_000747 [Perkinsus chesapeaki]
MSYPSFVVRRLLVGIYIWYSIVLCGANPNGQYCKTLGVVNKISLDFHNKVFDIYVRKAVSRGSAKNVDYQMNGDDQLKVNISNSNLVALYNKITPPISLKALEIIGYQNDILAVFAHPYGFVFFKKENC